MRPVFTVAALAVAWLVAAGCGSTSQARGPGEEEPTAKPDARVQRALDALDLNYEVDQDADFKLGFGMDGGRSQVLFVASGTDRLGELEIRNVWSYVHQYRGALTQEDAAWLLTRNDQVKLGSFAVVPLGDGTRAVAFVVKVDANGSPDDIRAALLAVAETADAAEQRFSSADIF